VSHVTELRIAIVGTGLMGASVALAAKQTGVARISGFDADPQALWAAVERGALDEASGSLEGVLEGADVAFVAVPVAELASVVPAVLSVSHECTVTDIGSTKVSVCAAAAGSRRFVGGHPVCGAAGRGAEHATADLFEAATWFLTPGPETDADRYKVVHGLVAELGALPIAIGAAAHDRLVALTSHLPHALANLIVNQAGARRIDGHDPLAAAGGSLRDLTRVAGANPRVWIDIFLDNRDVLLEELAEHRLAVQALEAALARRDADFLAAWIGEAAGKRRRILEAAYATDPGDLHRLRVHVPDRPGVLAGITQALGARRINIEDFELHHLSAERGGILGVLVAGAGEAQRAAELLRAQGYGVLVAPV
jgi:prephenate dehydrogenase